MCVDDHLLERLLLSASVCVLGRRLQGRDGVAAGATEALPGTHLPRPGTPALTAAADGAVGGQGDDGGSAPFGTPFGAPFGTP